MKAAQARSERLGSLFCPSPFGTVLLAPSTSFTMRVLSVFAMILTAASTAYAAAAPKPSGAPTCAYTCPTKDSSDFQLVGTHALTSTSVRCDYYPINVDNTSYTCTYNTQVRSPKTGISFRILTERRPVPSRVTATVVSAPKPAARCARLRRPSVTRTVYTRPASATSLSVPPLGLQTPQRRPL
jgi:hypothetical protein